MDPTSIPVVGKIVEKISDIIVAALFSHLNYMFCSRSLVEDLKSENNKLEIVENRMSRKADGERSNGKTLEKHVVDWREEARQNQEGVKSCLEKYDNRPSGRCFGFLPIPHPLSRYRLGKEAEKIAKTTTELATSGDRHLANPIAYLRLDMNAPVTGFHEFKSREEAIENLTRLVNDDSSSILGIYGIAGAGKTRLMERITTEAGKKGTFDKVIRANVGNDKLDVIGIQEQLAGKLGCDFESKTDSGSRANQLRSSLRQGGKVLVILDDIWREIPLDTIGILSADGMSSIGGKILLTSRNEEVCKLNNCEHLVEIKSLTNAESWDMFSKTVGAATIDSLQDISLAQDICKRCGGLPLVILAVGKALKFKPPVSWTDAHNQLKNSKIEAVSGISKDVHVCLKWSFDNLDDDAKACLLLASIFPEDADISMRELVQLARGSSQFVGSSSHMKGDEIRTRVHSMISTLNSASLLLQGKDSEHMKLHDIIRDMARSIATKDYAFLFARSGSLSNNPAEYSARKFLHIDVEKETSLHFPSNVKCPELHTLSLYSSSWKRPLIQDWINGEIFTNLIFLVLVRFSWPQELSLKSLGELKTLWFHKCDLEFFGETDVKILPEGLENLCIWESRMPEQLNVPELSHLRKLDIYSSSGRRLCMVPNTISRLSTLEELRLTSKVYINDECAEGFPLSGLDEISELPLTSLHIRSRVSKSSKLATMFSNLLEFHLFVVGQPTVDWFVIESPVSVTKSITLFNHDLVEGYQTLFQKAEEVTLFDTDFPGSSIGIRDTKEFINLRYMQIEYCEAMKYLARMSSPHTEIQESLQRSTPFSNLIKLEIKRCLSLKYLFCNSIARCLLLLEELHIMDCPLMEEVVRGEGKSDGNIINMSKLRIMSLIRLPRLVHFYKDKISCAQIQPLFDGMVVFPSLEKLDITGLKDITDIWGDNHDNASSFSQLKTLKVSFCDKLKNVIPPATLRSSLTSEVDTHGSHTDLVTGRAPEGLVKAVVSHNPYKKLQIFLKKTVRASRSVCRRTPTITEENLNDPSDISVQVPSQNTKVCPLVEMRLQCLSCLEKTGLNFEDQSGAVSLYPDLKKLKIIACERLENVFIIPCTNGHLMNLEKMSVRECITMREIIGAGPAGKHKMANGIVFHKLCSLQLTYLPSLTSFWVEASGEANSHKVEFPNLKTLQLRCGENTSLLEVIESGIDVSGFQLEKLEISCDEEIQIPNRWLLQLDNLESLSLVRCWSDELKSLRFQRLNKLTLGELSCSSIFSFPDFERLQQLKELKVNDCRMLEGIVEVARGDETSDRIITFPQLSIIELRDLPNLQNFSPATSYSFKMPRLHFFRLRSCPQVGNKPFLRIIAEQVRVYSDEHPEGIVVENLNDYSRRINKLQSVGESSKSNQDVEVEEEEEGVVVQEENEIQEET